MGILELFGKETYPAECPRCHQALKLSRDEVAAGTYTCPVCEKKNRVPREVVARYKARRTKEEKERKEKERKRHRREKTKKEREKQKAARQEKERIEKETKRKARAAKAQKAKEEAQTAKKRREEALRSGKCPGCGGELQVMKKGYDTGTGAACCCLTGPVGLLGGFLGSEKKQRVCKGCGKEFPFGSRGETNAAGVIVIVIVVLVVLLALGSC